MRFMNTVLDLTLYRLGTDIVSPNDGLTFTERNVANVSSTLATYPGIVIPFSTGGTVPASFLIFVEARDKMLCLPVLVVRISPDLY